jgi:hypothetical protein
LEGDLNAGSDLYCRRQYRADEGKSMNKRKLLPAVSACAVMFLFTGAAAAAEIRVTIRNLAPQNGTYLTPVWVGFHNGAFDTFDSGLAASIALERLAEDGDTAPLSSAFALSGNGSQDATLMGPAGPIAPGQTTSMLFSVDPFAATGMYMSYASMVIPSNDAFIANGNPMAIEIFNPAGGFVGGTFIVMGSMVWDAGTEVNDEAPMNTAFLGQMAPNTGVTENGVVMLHPGFIAGGNILSTPMFANADFKAPGYQVAQITIEAIPEPATISLIAGPLLLLAIRHRRRR